MSPSPRAARGALSAAALVLSFGCALFSACSDDPAPATPDAGFEAAPPDPVRDASRRPARGARRVGVEIQAGTRDFLAELREVREATGMNAANLSFVWDAVEVPNTPDADGGEAGADASDDADPGDAGAPDAGDDAEAGAGTVLFNPYFHIANLVYPQEKLAVTLALNPVDTNGPHLPADLRGRALDAPEVASRFNAMQDYALRELPNVDLAWLVLGHEVDVGLGDAEASYAAFTKLFVAAAQHAKTKRPGIKVGFVVSHRALSPPKRAFLTAAWAASDFVGVTYFPVDQRFQAIAPSGVRKAFGDLVAAAPPDKPVVFHEVGYPTSEASGSSALGQAAFLEELLRAWDDQQARVPSLTYFHSSDFLPERVTELMSYYNVQDPTFRAMLGSFGLREVDGTPKAGFYVFGSELRARGW